MSFSLHQSAKHIMQWKEAQHTICEVCVKMDQRWKPIVLTDHILFTRCTALVEVNLRMAVQEISADTTPLTKAIATFIEPRLLALHLLVQQG